MSSHSKNVIFVDGANVAKEYETGKNFSVVGLLRCAVYFRQHEFHMKVILNRNWRALASNGRLDDGEQLMKLEAGSAGIIVYTPIDSDEKEFLIQSALDHAGVIVSNESYENEKAKRQDWAHFLNRRCLPFRFVNREFAPMPPTVDGRVVDVEEFLHSAYNVGGDLSSAAALTKYLLTMKVDDNGESPGIDNVRGDNQRFRVSRGAGPPPAPLRRYTAGQIMEVSPESAVVEFQISKDGNAAVSCFDREAYRPNGRVVRDMRQEFRLGDWIGFISEKSSARGDPRWRVIEVRKKAEMRRGYGRYRPLANETTSGIIEARYKAEAGGGDVFFPGAAFREDDTPLTSLTRGHWLYYYAFDQRPSAGCTAVAVEVFSATAAGVIVKKTGRHVYVWSTKTGLARGDAVRFLEGDWVKFDFQQRTESGHAQWIISNVEMISPPAGVTVETENLESSNETLVHVRCPAVAGIITETHGAIWTEAFGRMVLPNNCLKHIRNTEPNGLQPYQPVRIWAIYNGDRNTAHHVEETSGDEATASSVRVHSTAAEGPWRVISLIVASGAAASGAESPYPPPSIIFGVEATLLQSEDDKSSERGQHWIFKSEKYGKIFATPLDLGGSMKQLSVGDHVKTSILPQPLRYGDEYRSFVMEKTHGPMAAAHGEESRNWKY